MGKKELATIDNIQNQIYTIRGVQIMLDSDLAVLYQVKTKVLNQAVKRNRNRFPERFCFQLTVNEVEILKSQIATSNVNRDLKSQIVTSSWGGSRTKPYAFTEQGVAINEI